MILDIKLLGMVLIYIKKVNRENNHG
jgi:hypothetical protein